MNSAKRTIGAAAIVLMMLAVSQAFAQDWPQWRGPGRDGKVAGFKAPDVWPKELTQKWKVTVGAGDAAPVLVAGKLYVFARQGEDEVTLCLNAETKEELWRDKYPVATIPGPSARQHAGPRGTPAVAEGKVVTLGVTGVLSCLDAANKGKLLWRKDEIKGTPKYFTGTSPIIVEGLAIAQLGGEDAGVIVAYDLATGNEKWKCPGRGSAYASPVLAAVEGVKQLVTLTNKNVVGIALADGKPLWEVPFPSQGMVYNAATPIVDGSTVIFTGQGRGTKAVKIEKKGDGFAATELWSNPLGTQFCSPVLKDGMLYGISDKGNLFCINAKSGETVWADSTKLGNYGAMLDAGSTILALPNNSQLLAFKPGEKQYVELAKLKVAETPTFACPVVAGNNIFVKDQDALILWTLN